MQYLHYRIDRNVAISNLTGCNRISHDHNSCMIYQENPVFGLELLGIVPVNQVSERSRHDMLISCDRNRLQIFP